MDKYKNFSNIDISYNNNIVDGCQTLPSEPACFASFSDFRQGAQRPLRLAVFSTSLPQKCGIATFTNDTVAALTALNVDADVIAFADDIANGYEFASAPSRVRYVASLHDRERYAAAANFVIQQQYDIVLVQFEYGIFGGTYGSYLLDALHRLRSAGVPIAVNFHTVLRNPKNQALKRVTQQILEYADMVFVMTESACSILDSIYLPVQVSQKCSFVPHGVVDNAPYVDPLTVKKNFGWENRTIVSTFGFIGPSKGIEYALEALGRLIGQHADVLYVIAGGTHPLMRDSLYGKQLQQIIEQYKLQNNVLFYRQSFLDYGELVHLLKASDMYLSPYPNDEQATSGTLALAASLGLPIVSTNYTHAVDLLADGRGIVVPTKNATALSRGLRKILKDREQMREMGCRVFAHARGFVWQTVAKTLLCHFYRHIIRQSLNLASQAILASEHSSLGERVGRSVSASLMEEQQSTVKEQLAQIRTYFFSGGLIFSRVANGQQNSVQFEFDATKIVARNPFLAVQFDTETGILTVQPTVPTLEGYTQKLTLSGDQLHFFANGNREEKLWSGARARSVAERQDDGSVAFVTTHVIVQEEVLLAILQRKLLLRPNVSFLEQTVSVVAKRNLDGARLVLGMDDTSSQELLFDSIHTRTDLSAPEAFGQILTTGKATSDVIAFNTALHGSSLRWYGVRSSKSGAVHLVLIEKGNELLSSLKSSLHNQHAQWVRGEFILGQLKSGQSVVLRDLRMVVPASVADLSQYDNIMLNLRTFQGKDLTIAQRDVGKVLSGLHTMLVMARDSVDIKKTVLELVESSVLPFSKETVGPLSDFFDRSLEIVSWVGIFEEKQKLMYLLQAAKVLDWWLPAAVQRANSTFSSPEKVSQMLHVLIVAIDKGIISDHSYMQLFKQLFDKLELDHKKQQVYVSVQGKFGTTRIPAQDGLELLSTSAMLHRLISAHELLDSLDSHESKQTIEKAKTALLFCEADIVKLGLRKAVASSYRFRKMDQGLLDWILYI